MPDYRVSTRAGRRYIVDAGLSAICDGDAFGRWRPTDIPSTHEQNVQGRLLASTPLWGGVGYGLSAEWPPVSVFDPSECHFVGTVRDWWRVGKTGQAASQVVDRGLVKSRKRRRWTSCNKAANSVVECAARSSGEVPVSVPPQPQSLLEALSVPSSGLSPEYCNFEMVAKAQWRCRQFSPQILDTANFLRHWMAGWGYC